MGSCGEFLRMFWGYYFISFYWGGNMGMRRGFKMRGERGGRTNGSWQATKNRSGLGVFFFFDFSEQKDKKRIKKMGYKAFNPI